MSAILSLQILFPSYNLQLSFEMVVSLQIYTSWLKWYYYAIQHNIDLKAVSNLSVRSQYNAQYLIHS